MLLNGRGPTRCCTSSWLHLFGRTYWRQNSKKLTTLSFAFQALMNFFL